MSGAFIVTHTTCLKQEKWRLERHLRRRPACRSVSNHPAHTRHPADTQTEQGLGSLPSPAPGPAHHPGTQDQAHTGLVHPLTDRFLHPRHSPPLLVLPLTSYSFRGSTTLCGETAALARAVWNIGGLASSLKHDICEYHHLVRILNLK